jgi:hypothetical protein
MTDEKAANNAKDLAPFDLHMEMAHRDLEIALSFAQKSCGTYELPVHDLWPIAQHLLDEANARVAEESEADDARSFADSLKNATEDPVLARFVAGTAQ